MCPLECQNEYYFKYICSDVFDQVSDFILNMHFHLSMANIYASYEGGKGVKQKNHE